MKRSILTSVLFCLVATAIGVAGGSINPITFPRHVVMTASGAEVFHVAREDAATSAAWRNNEDLTSREGVVPSPTEGYTLKNRVVVRVNDPRALDDVLATRLSADVVEFDAVPGFWLVEVSTVGDAIELANDLATDIRVQEAYILMERPRVLRVPDDPYYEDQWHLDNADDPETDVNVVPAWDAGYTGSGVVIGILEGAWEHDHPDLAPNFNAAGTQSGGWVTPHATSCAGVAAAAAYNNTGVVGVAFGAQISGQLYGDDAETAEAFAYRNDINDIKSNSWGPPDNGRITYMPSIERAAIEDAIAFGRGGLGEIIVWAAGNGGLDDRVEYDPYASSRYTCAIGAIGDSDYRSYYNERGASMLAVTHSNGNSRGIVTTTYGGSYTYSFGGTSSASPLAAGVIALMLDANPDLTWRDVQHIIVHSSRKCDPAHVDWSQNGAGHDINYNYGFGAMDAHAATTLASEWQAVGPEVVADSGLVPVNVSLPDDSSIGHTVTIDIPENIRIESVELIVNVATSSVGDLEIRFTSPDGTESVVAERRYDGADDYNDYIFTSLRHWDEMSAGQWSVYIADLDSGYTATWEDVRLRIYGTNTVGDMNCDGVIDFADINPFVTALSGAVAYEAAYPDCHHSHADVNGDGVVDFDDINPFVALLAP